MTQMIDAQGITLKELAEFFIADFNREWTLYFQRPDTKSKNIIDKKTSENIEKITSKLGPIKWVEFGSLRNLRIIILKQEASYPFSATDISSGLTQLIIEFHAFGDYHIISIVGDKNIDKFIKILTKKLGM